MLRIRRVGAVFAALLIALSIIAVPGNAPQAQAQTTTQDSLNFGDCAMRIGTGTAEAWANQICWIDAKGLTANGTVTKKIGGYTLTFNVNVATDGALSTLTNPGWNLAAFGKAGTGFFERNPNATVQDVLQMNYTSQPNPSARITLSNVALTDPSGRTVSNLRLLVADAESTGAGTPGEIISVESGNGGVDILGRVTPSGSYPACTRTDAIFGPATEPARSEWKNAGGRVRDFVCYTRSSGTYGTFVVGADNPGSLEISMGTDNRGAQGVALGIAIGRVTFGSANQLATVDSAFENAATGTASTANYQAFQLDNGIYSEIPVSPNTTTPVVRRIGAGAVPQDSYAFRSTANTADGQAFNRYDPVWSCTLTNTAGTPESFTIREGVAAPAGFVLANDKAAGTSEVRVAAAQNRAVNCAVRWESRFQPAAIELKKTVTGSAANFRDVQGRTFDITYACADVPGTGPGSPLFTNAYPGVKLQNTVTLAHGATQTAPNLPRGAQCTVTESRTTSTPPAGVSHDLQWNSASTTAPAAPNGGVNTYSVTLGATNPAYATNRYDYRSGTLRLSTELLGEPIADGVNLSAFDVELICVASNLGRKVVTLNTTRTATVVAGTADITDVPVAQDCTIRPLTELPQVQSGQIRVDNRTVTFGGQTVQPDAAAPNTYHFSLPDTQGVTGLMSIRTTYVYNTRDIAVRKHIDGPAATSPDLSNPSYTVNYRCTAPSGKVFTGTKSLGGSGSEAAITAIPVGSNCNVWENTPGDTANTLFAGAKLQSTDAGGRQTVVDNAAAQTTPILTVWATPGQEQHIITLTNTYNPRLGTVSVSKVVTSTTTAVIPNSFTIRFNCGTRTIGGSVIDLSGSAEILGGSTAALRADNPAANDQGGVMGVPYGNSCSFSEDQPQLTQSVRMSTNVADATFTVSQPVTTRTVTNTFASAGDGLTVTQSLDGVASLIPAGGMNYSLTCEVAPQPATLAAAQIADAAAGTATEAIVAIPTFITEEFSLSNAEQFHLPADKLPLGSTCTITEATPDSLQRTNFSGHTYTIDRVVALSSTDPSAIDFGVEFTIGEKSVLNVSATYAYLQADVRATKRVEFDADGQRLISPTRRDAISAGDFTVAVVCHAPDGTQGTTVTGTVTDGGSVNLPGVTQGSECTVSENLLPPTGGITHSTRIAAGGAAAVVDGPATFTVGASGNETAVTNVFSRSSTTATLSNSIDLPPAVREQFEAGGGVIGASISAVPFTLACRDAEADAGSEVYRQARTVPADETATFAGVPVGAHCEVTAGARGPVELSLGELRAYLRPEDAEWAVGANAAIAQTDAAETTSPGIIANGGTDAANQFAFNQRYAYEMAPVALSKRVTGQAKDLDLITDETRFNFTMRCEAIGYSSTNVLPTSLAKSDFDTTGEQWTYTSAAAEIPAGALCEVTETDPTALPVELTATAEPGSVSGRAPLPGVSEAAEFAFTNTVERRMAPVRLALLHTGYLVGASPAGYTAQFACGDYTFTRTYALDSVPSGTLNTNGPAPSTGDLVDVPVGLECTVDFSASPALAARGEVEVVNGDRRPTVRFAQWEGDTYVGAPHPLGFIARALSPATSEETTFAVPGDAPSDSPVVTVGTEITHTRALYDVAFSKLSEGNAANAPTFTFTQSCSPGGETFTLKPGGTHIIKDIPVNQDCTVIETDDAHPDVDSVFTIAQVGSLTKDTTEPAAGGASRQVSFVALPTSGEDTSTAGDQWSVTALNRFPGLEVTKRIPGTPISVVTGVFDRAILGDAAETMEITYTVENTGVFDAELAQVVDSSLAGRTISSATGASAVVGADGVLTAEVCPALAAGRILAPGESVTCTINVDISDQPRNANYSYFGDVEVHATSNGQTFTATDGYGAFRMSGLIGAMLPDTGVQTLVWLLVLGLLLFGVGAWRYLRRDDAEIEAGESVEAR
ncbi:DUF5979 domain-containing protein [Corynebacterium mycetoides]|nr:CshA/CshB family fibrillar adhesin-related protein [Corynebacterium mycetoides]